MLAAAALVADYAFTLELSDRSEARARTQKPSPTGGAGWGAGFDLFTQPQGQLRIANRHLDFSVAYSAALTVPDLELGFTPLLFNTGTAHIDWHSRKVRISVSETATYGEENSAYLLPPQAGQPAVAQPQPPGQPQTPPPSPAPAPALQAAPAPSNIEFGSTSTQADIAASLGRRSTVGVFGNYTVSGGINEVSRTYIPEEYGPRASVYYDYTLSRRAQFVTRVSGQRTDFTQAACITPNGQVDPTQLCAPQAELLQGEGLFRYNLARPTLFTLGAGVAGTYWRKRPDLPYGSGQPFPVAESTVRHAFGPRGTDFFDVSARLLPYVDFRTGLLGESAQLQTSLYDLWTGPSRPLAFRLAAGLAQSLPPQSPAAATFVHGDVEVDYLASRRTSLAIGERGLWQSQIGFGVFASAFTYIAVTVRERPLRF